MHLSFWSFWLKKLKCRETKRGVSRKLNMTRFHVSLRASVTSAAINNQKNPQIVMLSVAKHLFWLLRLKILSPQMQLQKIFYKACLNCCLAININVLSYSNKLISRIMSTCFFISAAIAKPSLMCAKHTCNPLIRAHLRAGTMSVSLQKTKILSTNFW